MMDDGRIRLPLDRLPLISLCDYLQCSEGFVHPDRVMDVNVLLYVEKGGFHLYEEDREYTLTPGTLLFLKQGLHHFGEGKCPNGTKWFFVHFHLPGESELQPGREVGPFDDYRYRENQPPEGCPYYLLPKQLKIDPEGPVFRKFLSLKENFRSTLPENHRRINADFYRILLDLYDRSHRERQVSSDVLRTDEVFHYIDENLCRPFSSEDLAQHLGLSYKHINLIFRNVTGTTIQKAFARARMERAAAMLRETDLEIREVAEAMGFPEQYYFSNLFKQHYGVSPAGYRKDAGTVI